MHLACSLASRVFAFVLAVRVAALWCAAVSSGAALCAQDLTLHNLADLPRKHWVDVAVPAVDAANLPRICRVDPHGWLALRGSAVGEHSVLYHVLAQLGARQRVTGTLTPVSNNALDLPPWQMSDWVADDTSAMLPMPVVLDTDGREHRLTQPRFDVVEDVSPARRVFHLWGRVGDSPFVFDAYIYVYSMQDSAEIECTLTCADPRLPTMNYGFVGIWLESGEYFDLDFRRRFNLPAPEFQNFAPQHASYGNWVQLIRGADVVRRGEGIYLTGAMQGFIGPGRTPAPSFYGTLGLGLQWSVADRVNALYARGEAPSTGAWLDWQDKWLAFGRTPEVPGPAQPTNGWADANKQWAWFLGLLQQPADLFADRPRGLHMFAGSTGAQEDFGACKGAFAVTVGDSRWIHDATYSVAELAFRGFHYREISGAPMWFRNHPTLRCFSQLPHCNTTGDTLGLPCPRPFGTPTNGWSTYDDQHRSQNNFNALLALTGRYGLRDQLRDLTEVDLAMVPGWMDQPRGEGRLLMALANMVLLSDDPQKRADLRQVMRDRLQTIQANWLGAPFVGNPAKPLRALKIGSDNAFFEPGTQKRVPAIIVWEHSIAAMGFFAAWRTTGEQGFLDLAREASRLVARHGIFQQGGQWHLCAAVRYRFGDREGDALPASSYHVGSPDVHVNPTYWPWSIPAVLICREVFTGQDPALVARCNQILQAVAPNGPSTWADSEWWAVLPR